MLILRAYIRASLPLVILPICIWITFVMFLVVTEGGQAFGDDPDLRRWRQCRDAKKLNCFASAELAPV